MEESLQRERETLLRLRNDLTAKLRLLEDDARALRTAQLETALEALVDGGSMWTEPEPHCDCIAAVLPAVYGRQCTQDSTLMQAFAPAETHRPT